MELIAQLLGQSGGSTPGPTDDYWYQPVGTVVGGVRVDEQGAKKLSAWYRGRDLLATSLAMLPLKVLERLPDDGGSLPAKANPLYDILHDEPNGWQDSFGWRRQMMYHLIDHGNAYNLIVPGSRGFVDQLWPVHPRLVTPERLSTGRVLYHVRDEKTNQTKIYTQDEVFHLMGASEDGLCGKGILEFARGSLGTALSTESYASKVFTNGTLNAGVIEVPGLLKDKDASTRMAESFKTSYGNWHLPKVLEQGAKWVKDDMTPEDAQMLLSRKFSVDDIARWLGVPPHMIGSLDRSTNNNIEQQGREFVTYSLGPWLSLWEFAVARQLILNRSKYFAEFVRDALVIGDIAARWNAYQIAVSTGTFTRNEVRRMENKNALDGLDKPLDPAHLTGKAQSGQAPTPAPADNSNSNARMARAEAIAAASASRLLRKEVTVIQKLAVKHAASPAGFVSALEAFYDEHAVAVADSLNVPIESARAYCHSQLAQVRRSDWIAALDTWQSKHYASGLAALALEGVAA